MQAQKDPAQVQVAQKATHAGYRLSSAMSDSMANTLFNQEPPISRHVFERKLRIEVRAAWEEIRNRLTKGQISQSQVQVLLEELDIWLDGRLSGQNVLALAREAEDEFAGWIRLMPRSLACRYEELRVARLWSALLNPEALNRLSSAIASERAIGQEDEKL